MQNSAPSSAASEEIGLTDEQIKLVVGMSQRLAMRGEAANGRRAAAPDWDAVKRRIEGAVKSGEMTREEADAVYRSIRERMAPGARPVNPR